jgi:predicted ArsR family transcriptional regulator
VESTREQVLRIVRGHREVTVAQLAADLDLSPQAVRRHLDSLRADGYVDVRLERHAIGRPALAYFATERGEEVSGRTYLQLLSRLLRHLEKDADAGQPAVLDQVFAGIAAEVAADHAAEVRGSSLDERIAEASAALEREGIVDGWSKDGDVFQIVNGDCPYLRLAEMSSAPCRADQQSIELLLRTQVDQTKRIVDGSPVCEYIIRPGAEAVAQATKLARSRPTGMRSLLKAKGTKNNA